MFRKYVEFFIQNLPNLLSVSFCGATIGFYPRITRILVVGFFLVLLGARHFLSYFKIPLSLCLNAPFSSIERTSFKHRKDPFQASKSPLSSIERTPFKHRPPPPPPRGTSAAPAPLIVSMAKLGLAKSVLCQKRKLLVAFGGSGAYAPFENSHPQYVWR